MQRLLLVSILLLTGSRAFGLGMGPTITEIHYHPAGSADEAGLEFIELYNQDPTPFDLSGYAFVAGVRFVFPSGTLLAGRSYLVLVSDEVAFASRYPRAQVAGEFDGRLDNSGEEVVLAHPAGMAVLRVRYRDAGAWPHAADGTGHSLALKTVHRDPADSASWTWSRELGGTPGAANFEAGAASFVDVPLIPKGATWSYLPGRAPPSEPSGAWRLPDFDASGWSEGRAGFGFGGGGSYGTPLDDMQGNYISLFVRREFRLDDPVLRADEQLALLMEYDDGFVAYLNGVEVARSAVGKEGEDTPFNARASQTRNAGEVEAFPLPGELLQHRNVLAVQGHNKLLGGGDFALDPVLVRRTETRGDASAPVRISEVANHADAARWVELQNLSTIPLGLDGFGLSNEAATLDRYPFPPGTTVPPKGYVVVQEVDLPFSLAASLERPLSVFLTEPGGARVVAAARVPAADAPTRTAAFYEGGGHRFSLLGTPTPGEANLVEVERDIVIHEIHYHPHFGSTASLGGEDSALEFVELFNRGEGPVDISGYSFTRGIRYEFPPGTVIGAGGFLVVAANPDVLAEAHGLSDVLGPFEGVLSNRGEVLVLEDAAHHVVDQVHYREGGEWPDAADGGGPSLELVDPFQDNRYGGAWAASDESTKSEWVEVRYGGRSEDGRYSELHLILQQGGTVRVDDVRVRAGDFENVIPGGDFETETDEWLFTGTHVHSRRITDDAFAGEACLELIASGRGDTRVNQVSVDTVPAVRDGASVEVSYAARWVEGSNVLTSRGSDHGFAKTVELPVPAHTGTPGAGNSRGLANLGPIITEIGQDPVVAQPGEPVRVFARILDSGGISEAQLFYREERTAEEYSRSAFFDDGAHGDGEAGDGLFAAEVAPFERGQKVLFYVAASDLQGAESIYPANGPDHPLLYQVDTRSFSAAHVYRVSLSLPDTRVLKGRPVLSNDLLRGTFVFDNDEVYYNVGVRYRGSPWVRHNESRGYRVRLEKDRPFHGWRKLNLDWTGSSLKERAAYYLMRYAGGDVRVPYSLQAHARYSFNGNHKGLYEHVQQVDSSYLDYWWPEDADGDLHKTDIRIDFESGGIVNAHSQALSYEGEDEEEYRYNYWLRGPREPADDFSSFIDLVKLMDPDVTPTGVWNDLVEDVVDVEQWIRVLTVRILDDDGDTFGQSHRNAFLYFARKEGRWKMIPFDSDNTFFVPGRNRNGPTGGFPGLRRLWDAPRFRRLHYRIVDEMLEGPFSVPFLRNYLDPTFNAVASESPASPDGIYAFVRRTEEVMRRGLPERRALEFTTPDPLVTDAQRVTLAGTAPYDVATLLVRGHETPIRWVSPQSWLLDLELEPGEHVIEILGFDHEGSLTASAATTVIVTARSERAFRRGDVNEDARVNVVDAFEILGHLYGRPSFSCLDAADVNDDGRIDLADGIRLLEFIFRWGSPPAQPFPDAGIDPTVDGLSCP